MTIAARPLVAEKPSACVSGRQGRERSRRILRSRFEGLRALARRLGRPRRPREVPSHQLPELFGQQLNPAMTVPPEAFGADCVTESGISPLSREVAIGDHFVEVNRRSHDGTKLQLISAHLSLPSIANMSPSNGLMASHNPKVAGSNPAPATDERPGYPALRSFGPRPHSG